MPPQPEVPSAATFVDGKVTSDGFEASWTPASGTAHYVIEVAEQTRVMGYSWFVPEGGEGVISYGFTVKGLTPQTTYVLRLTAVNSAGKSVGPVSGPVTTLSYEEDCARLRGLLSGPAREAEAEQLRSAARKIDEYMAKLARAEAVRQAASQAKIAAEAKLLGVEAALEAASSRVAELDKQVVEVTGQLAAAKSNAAAAQARAEAAEARLIDAEDRALAAEGDSAANEARHNEAVTRLEARNAELAELRCEVDAVRAAGASGTAERDAQLSSAVTARDEAVAAADAAKAERDALQAALADLRAQTDDEMQRLRDTIVGLQADKDALAKEISVKDKAHAALVAERDELKAQVSRLAEELAAAKAAGGAQSEATTAAEASLKVEQGKAAALSAACTELRARNEKLDDENQALREANSSLSADVVRLTAQLKQEDHADADEAGGAASAVPDEAEAEAASGAGAADASMARVDELQAELAVMEARAQKAEAEAQSHAGRADAAVADIVALRKAHEELTNAITAANDSYAERIVKTHAQLSAAQAAREAASAEAGRWKARHAAATAEFEEASKTAAARSDEDAANLREYASVIDSLHARVADLTATLEQERKAHSDRAEEAERLVSMSTAARDAARRERDAATEVAERMTQRVEELEAAASATEAPAQRVRELEAELQRALATVSYLEEANNLIEAENQRLTEAAALAVDAPSADAAPAAPPAAAAAVPVDATADAAVPVPVDAVAAAGAAGGAASSGAAPAEDGAGEIEEDDDVGERRASIAFLRAHNFSDQELLGGLHHLQALREMGFTEAKARVAVVAHKGDLRMQTALLVHSARAER